MYTRVHNCEVMLRVSTLLPLDQVQSLFLFVFCLFDLVFEKDDAAQLLRTRFLSQSQCLVVFQVEEEELRADLVC